MSIPKVLKECTTGIKLDNITDPTQKLRGSRYDFVQLILYPDRLLNWLNKFKLQGTDWTRLSRKSNMSSANKDMWCEVFLTDIGSVSSDWRTAWARGSKDRSNSKVERGQPYRVPLPIRKDCEHTWPVRIVAEGLTYKILIIFIKLELKPRWSSTAHK